MFFKTARNPIFELSDVQQACFVSPYDFADEMPVESVNSGDLVFNYCSWHTAKANLSKLNKDAEGMQLYFQQIDLQNLLVTLKAECVSTEELGDLTVINAYTPYYFDCVYVQNKKVNMQIALKENQVVVGFPMILTGY